MKLLRGTRPGPLQSPPLLDLGDDLHRSRHVYISTVSAGVSFQRLYKKTERVQVGLRRFDTFDGAKPRFLDRGKSAAQYQPLPYRGLQTGESNGLICLTWPLDYFTCFSIIPEEILCLEQLSA
jgi:hypothetical protein